MNFQSPTSPPHKLVLLSAILLLMLSACSSLVYPTQMTSQPEVRATDGGAILVIDQTATPSATETPSMCIEDEGTIVEEQITSELLGEEVSVKIYLPPCYNAHTNTEYSALYMLHGQTSMDDQWVRIGLLAGMDQLLAEGKVSPFLIILPNEAKTNLDSYHSMYGEALVEEVIPYIEENYRVCVQRYCRAIGGLSRGGNWAIHLGFTYPKLFAAIGAHSAPLFYGEMSTISLAVSDLQILDSLPVFYIDVGSRDPDLEKVLSFNETLKEYNIQRQFNEFVGYHDEKYWSAHVQDYLVWYSSQLKVPADR